MSDSGLKIDSINTPKKAGLALKRLRKQRGLSQADLAKIMNMRQPTISDVESGKGTLDSFFKIIQALKINVVMSTSAESAKSAKKTTISKMLGHLADGE